MKKLSDYSRNTVRVFVGEDSSDRAVKLVLISDNTYLDQSDIDYFLEIFSEELANFIAHKLNYKITQ